MERPSIPKFQSVSAEREPPARPLSPPVPALANAAGLGHMSDLFEETAADELSRQLAGAQRELSLKDENENSLRSQNGSLQSENEMLQNDIRRMKETINQMGKGKRDQVDKMSQNNKERAAALSTVQELEKTIMQCNTKLRRAEEKLKSYEKKMKTMEQDLSFKTDELKRVQGKYAKVEGEMKRFEEMMCQKMSVLADVSDGGAGGEAPLSARKSLGSAPWNHWGKALSNAVVTVKALQAEIVALQNEKPRASPVQNSRAVVPTSPKDYMAHRTERGPHTKAAREISKDSTRDSANSKSTMSSKRMTPRQVSRQHAPAQVHVQQIPNEEFQALKLQLAETTKKLQQKEDEVCEIQNAADEHRFSQDKILDEIKKEVEVLRARDHRRQGLMTATSPVAVSRNHNAPAASRTAPASTDKSNRRTQQQPDKTPLSPMFMRSPRRVTRKAALPEAATSSARRKPKSNPNSNEGTSSRKPAVPVQHKAPTASPRGGQRSPGRIIIQTAKDAPTSSPTPQLQQGQVLNATQRVLNPNYMHPSMPGLSSSAAAYPSTFTTTFPHNATMQAVNPYSSEFLHFHAGFP